MKIDSIAFTAFAVLAALSSASAASITVTGQGPGPSPFIRVLQLTVDDAAALDSIDFKVYPKPYSETRPVYARYSKSYLQGRGLLNPGTGEIDLPVFGLYSDYDNRVDIVSTFTDQTKQRESVTMTTPVWVDPSAVYENPTQETPRAPNTTLSYDFVLFRNFSTGNTPIIIDTDGEIRWTGTSGFASSSCLFFEKGLYLINSTPTVDGTMLVRMEFDGTFNIVADYAGEGVTGLHHNFDYGKTGILIEADTTTQFESVTFEVDGAGTILKRWDFADIFRDVMDAPGSGDSSVGFVRNLGDPSEDWFHQNATTYRASDDTLIASAREIGVVAVDYDTGALKWILGDTTKAWYVNHPSLRPYALSLGAGTSPPIGQHAVSTVRDRLLLFDNGRNSINHTPPGTNRTINFGRTYAIDEVVLSADEIWTYEAPASIFSTFCSSVYEDGSRNHLFAHAQVTALVGLDSFGNVVFDYRYTPMGCGTIYNAIPIHLENLRFE